MFERYKKYYFYGIGFLALGIILVYLTENDPPSDPHVIGVAFVAFSTFYLLGVGVLHFVGWAFGNLGHTDRPSESKNSEDLPSK